MRARIALKLLAAAALAFLILVYAREQVDFVYTGF